jgi:hypothetical protein
MKISKNLLLIILISGSIILLSFAYISSNKKNTTDTHQKGLQLWNGLHPKVVQAARRQMLQCQALTKEC